MPKKLGRYEFIWKAIQVHGYQDDLREVDYTYSKNKIKIICEKHGEFFITPNNYLRGKRCGKCKNRNLSNEEWIEIAKQIHKNEDGTPKYDYSKVEYKGVGKKVCIICSKHGEFWQLPESHLYGYGCKKCVSEKTNKNIIKSKSLLEKLKYLYGNRYDFSLIKNTYKYNYKDVVDVICPIHGKFKTTISALLKRSYREKCPKCNGSISKDEFIKQAQEIHKNEDGTPKYDYSKVEYVNKTTKVCIICSEHGEFWQEPRNHLKGLVGCEKCKGEKIRKSLALSTEEFIKKSMETYGDKYDYSKVKYINNNTNVCFICKKCGNEFWQLPSNHLVNSSCPFCDNKISKLEEEISQFLTENKIQFIQYHKFIWLKYNKSQTLDFYLPEFNIAIECQGIQHFEPVEHFGGEETLKYTMLMDENKNKLCKEHNITILYYTNQTQIKDYFLGKLIYNKEDLLKEILEYGNNQ